MSRLPSSGASPSIGAEYSDDDSSSVSNLVGNIESFLQNLRSAEAASFNSSNRQPPDLSSNSVITSPQGAKDTDRFVPRKEMTSDVSVLVSVNFLVKLTL